MNWKTAFLIVSLGALLVASAWGLWPIFEKYGGAMSIHGWIALGLGTVLSLALGIGLMALSFFSARRGFDERAHWEEGEEEDRP